MIYCFEMSVQAIGFFVSLLSFILGIIVHRIITKPIDEDAAQYNCMGIRLPPKDTPPMPPLTKPKK